MHLLLVLALMQAAPAAPVAGEPLRSGCFDDDQQIASITSKDRVRVEMALAGESQTCYKVMVTRGDENLAGYVLGESLPAVAQFVHGRERASQAAAELDARLAREAARKPSEKPGEPAAKPTDPLVSTQFEDFSAKDANGKPISLSGLKGQVTVVSFWSPGNKGTISQLESVMPLYNQFHSKGLAAVGVSTDPRADHVWQALDDVTLPFAQVPDQSGLAAKYHIDPRAGKTLVLDASHKIVAAGPMGPEIVKAVQHLLNVPENQ
ncbi:MAG TPA: TlpA disulfide reductase family protein [Terriglobales bacterium]|nr:TlpA disulfide reductase family protein [Terriglobales bacterium]